MNTNESKPLAFAEGKMEGQSHCVARAWSQDSKGQRRPRPARHPSHRQGAEFRCSAGTRVHRGLNGLSLPLSVCPWPQIKAVQTEEGFTYMTALLKTATAHGASSKKILLFAIFIYTVWGERGITDGGFGKTQNARAVVPNQ